MKFSKNTFVNQLIFKKAEMLHFNIYINQDPSVPKTPVLQQSLILANKFEKAGT
jgi:hypothetical protein